MIVLRRNDVGRPGHAATIGEVPVRHHRHRGSHLSDKKQLKIHSGPASTRFLPAEQGAVHLVENWKVFAVTSHTKNEKSFLISFFTWSLKAYLIGNGRWRRQIINVDIVYLTIELRHHVVIHVVSLGRVVSRVHRRSAWMPQDSTVGHRHLMRR